MSRAVRIAVIGSGPAAFYGADYLLRSADIEASVDMFERLPTPFGLVRAGVAPDHQKIKGVTRAFDEVAHHPRFRFFGCVEFGRDVGIDDLRRFYDQVLFATGAQSDRRMGIPGEDLAGSHPATEFVAWYNGHPDFRDRTFNLSAERVAIVGVGNVAIDVARILCLSPDELRASDMAQHAVEALSASAVREVYLLGRRGPAQAAFTNPELKELGDLAAADVVVDPAEAELDPLSAADLEQSGDRTLARKIALLQEFAKRPQRGHSRRLHLRFCVSPVEVKAGSAGAVAGLQLVKNRLSRTEAGTIVAEPTGESEQLAVELLFRSVGYRGAPLAGLPFNDRWGVILNEKGRVLDPATGKPMAGMYTAGWIKRGPSGVIGTNKPDAAETAALMVEDIIADELPRPACPGGDIASDLLAPRGVRSVSYADWEAIDRAELERGKAMGRPRVKFTSVEEMIGCLDHGRGAL